MRRRSWGIVVPFVLGVLAAGCGKDATEDADVDIDSGGMHIESKDGSMTVGENTKLPDGWPDDAPVYKGLQLQTAVTSGEEFAVVGTTSDGLQKVAAYFKEEAGKQGWTEDTSMTQAQMVMLTYTKDNRTFNVVINSDGSETTASINVSK